MALKFYDWPVRGWPSLNGAIWALFSSIGLMLVAALILWTVMK